MILTHKDRGRFESFFWQGKPDECWQWLGSTRQIGALFGVSGQTVSRYINAKRRVRQ